LFAKIFARRRAKQIERYTETSIGNSERERERTDRGGCRRRHKDDDEDAEEEEKEEEKQKRANETYTWLRGPRRSGFSHRLETPTPAPTLT
jgi:hypothetical protein